MRYEQIEDLTLTECSFDEFVTLAKTMGTDTLECKDKSERFYGDTKSFNDMVKRCYDGYNAKEIIQARDIIVEGLTTDRAGYILSDEGEEVDMPSFIAGEEKCYWRKVKVDKMPKVHLVFASNCVGGVRAESFINHGGFVAGICELLADTCDLKVSGCFSNTYVYRGKGLNFFSLKDYSEPVDIPRLGAVTHPAFFRRIGFAWLEGLGGYLKKDGFSTSYGCSETGKDREKVCSDEHLIEFVGLDKEEILVELPAGDLDCFTSSERTTAYTKGTIEKIIEAIKGGEKYIKAW
jgi:hypothetical protein